MDALSRAISLFGSQAALSRALGLRSPMAVSHWRRNGVVPIARCIDIERATGCQVTRYDLRPDIFGPAPRQHG